MRLRSRTGLAGALSILLALVLVPIAFFVFTVLEPQRQHMLERNLRVLNETGRELEAQFERLSFLIKFSLVPVGTPSDPESVIDRLEAAEKAHELAQAGVGQHTDPDTVSRDVQPDSAYAPQIDFLEARRSFLEDERKLLGAGQASKRGSTAARALDREIGKIARQTTTLERRRSSGVEMARSVRVAALPSRQTRAEAEQALRAAEDARTRAKRLSGYLEGLRKTREYRAIEITATGPCESGADAKTIYEVTGQAPGTRVLATGCRRALDSEKPLEWDTVEIGLPFADLADPLDSAAAAAFDQLVIVSGNGKVLHASRGGPLLPADRLPALLRTARATGSVARLGSLVGDDDAELAGSGASSQDPTAVLRAARRHPVEVEIGETWYRVFAHPVRSPTAEDGDWFVVGIVSDARFSSGSLASSRSQLALAISGLVLMLLAWPWLRLLFSGPRERISIREILELVTSLALAIGLLTLVVADLSSRAVLKRHLDQTAVDLSHRIEADFRAELAETLAALQAARERICISGLPTSWDMRGDALVYPPYDVAFVLDERGVQMGEQANYRSGEVSTIRVASREYFQRARDGRTWRLGPEPEQRFFLQRIKTYDHGWRLSAVSAPASDPEGLVGTVCNGAAAVALTRRFASLTSVVLPPGFGFAIIDDETGEVPFHSSDSRSLVENFVAETGPDPRLTNLVGQRRTRTLEGRYRTEGAHRFRVHPLRGLPWTLVVFQRTGIYDVLRFEMLLAAGSYLGIYVVVLLAASLLAAWLTPGSRWSWLWPTDRRRARYRRAVVFVVLVGLFDILSVLWLRGTDLLIPIFTLPPAALGAVYLALYAGNGVERRGRTAARICLGIGAVGAGVVIAKVVGGSQVDLLRAGVLLVVAGLAIHAGRRVARAKEGSDQPGNRIAYFALLLAMLGVVVVLPALAVFKDVQRAALDRVTRLGQRAAVAAAIERHEGLRADAERIAPERFREDPALVVVREEGAACRGLYVQPGILAAPRSGEGPGPARGGVGSGGICSAIEVLPEGCPEDPEPYAAAFSVGLTRQLPGVSQTALELRQLFDPGAGDRSECWSSVADTETPGLFGDAASDELEYRKQHGEGSFRMVSARLPIPVPGEPGEWALVLVGVAGTTGLAVLLFWLLGNRVLGLRIPDAMGAERLTAPRDDQENAPADAAVGACDRLVLFPPPGWARGLCERLERAGRAVERVDAGALSTWVSSTQGDQRLLVVTDLHLCLPDDASREAALARLEAIQRDGQQRVVLCSDVHPLDYLRTSTFVPGTIAAEGAPGDDGARRRLDRERLRWGEVLAGLRPTRIDWDPPPLDPGAHPSLSAALRRECDWTPWLADLRDEIAADPRFRSGEIDERELVHWVAERAEPLFRRIWALLPAEDRLAIVQLAEGNLLNPRNSAMIERLMRRGLICRDGTFRLVSRSFALFATRVELPARLQDWERSAAGGHWNLVRIPLAAIFLLVLAYAVYAGRGTVDATLAAIPAVVAGFPTVIRILGSLRMAGGAPGSGNVG